jgi:polyhydroxybutyrate depolymerase
MTLPGTLETYEVGATSRTALLFAPSAVAPSPAPLVFVFHGRGGTAQGAADRLALHRHWPEAWSVYPQGVAGQKAMRDPDGTRPSWQRMPGELEDRDVRFFDAALAALISRHGCDPRRVYLLGQSNGGRFANLLWNQRGESIAALASAGSQGGRLIAEAPPRSVLMVIGEKDRVAPREGQEKSIALARARLGTEPDAVTTDGALRSERSPAGLELAVYLHPGGHEFPRAALPVIAAFFARHRLPDAG